MNDFLIGKSTCAKCGKTFPYIKATLYAPKWCNDCISRYADAEAEGLLVVLPCKVGDTVYAVDWYLDCDIDGFAVCDDYDKEGDRACGYCRHNYVKKFVREKKYEPQMIADIGKTVFLTREEAEAALEGEGE